MRLFLLPGVFLLVFSAAAQTSPEKLWAELEVKRDKLAGLHQEFQLSQVFKTVRDSQASERQSIVDIAPGVWRELIISGSGDRVRLFDGKDSFFMDEGGDEYVRIKPKNYQDRPLPNPYHFPDFEWSKAKELERRPCGLSGTDRSCVILQIPLKRWVHMGRNGHMNTLVGGVTQVVLDPETGALIQSKTVESIDNGREGYQSELTYSLKTMRYAATEPALFRLPAELREVKQLTPWNASKIRKQLAGKPAPELAVNDIQGRPVSLTAFKGKTVLLDFWATWCPPCRADVPSLEKLNRKYGDKELAIVSISVSEEREIVEKFLKQHPHSYPVVLSSENEMPRPYQIGVFPTYMVIDQDGNLTAAVEGDQGFGELRKLLKKAGMDTD